MTVPYQRALTYSANVNYKVEEWFLSKKYDGIRCYYDRESDLMLFRSGRIIVRMEHIQNHLRLICDSYNLKAVDGELYVPGLKYREIASLVNGQKKITDEQKQSVMLAVFACRSSNHTFTTPEMINTLEAFPSSDRIITVKYEKIANDFSLIEQRASEIQANGWEGVVLRHPIVSYEEGSSRKLVKLVVYHKGVFEIIGFAEGTGSYSGSLGGLLIQGFGLNEDFTEKPVKSRVSSGLKRSERNEIWENRDKYLGIAVNVDYQKVQDSKLDTDGFGSLRFPKYKGVMKECNLIRFSK